MYGFIPKDGYEQEQYFERLSNPEYLDYTSFEGSWEAMEIAYQMKRGQDIAQDQDWEARGIQVKEETWKVLLDWKNAISARAWLAKVSHFIPGNDYAPLRWDQLNVSGIFGGLEFGCEDDSQSDFLGK